MKRNYELVKEYFKAWIKERPHLKDYLKPKETPLLLLDLRGIRGRFLEIKENFKGFQIYYALKANDDQRIVKLLSSLGSGFEVASGEELSNVLKFVSPERVISSNPVKPMEFIDYACKEKIKALCVDSFYEVDKIAKVCKRAKIYVRLAVPNEGSEWPLSRKFGADLKTALEILEYAKEKSLIPYGITFHVGSQCNNLRNWLIGIKLISNLWRECRRRGIRLYMLNLGGGIPVKYMREVLKVEDVAYYLKGLLRKFLYERPMEVCIEPGRGVVGDQGLLITRVIGRAKRGDEDWLYIDCGVFNGLAEVLGGIRYPIYSTKEGDLGEFFIGGVSCDGMDVVAERVELPRTLEVGDYLYFMSAGAYTSVYASHFNGFPPPKVLAVS